MQVTFLRDFCATPDGAGYDAGETATFNDRFANQLIAYDIAKPVATPAPPTPQPYEVGCSNKWDFNVGLNDLIGSNNLTNYGARQNTGYYTFDGTDDYLEGSLAYASLSNQLSIEFIASVPAGSGAGNLIDFNGAGAEDMKIIAYPAYPSYRFVPSTLYDGDAVFSPTCTSGVPTHFVVTFDNTTENVTWYMNGGNKSVFTEAAGVSVPVDTFTLYLGCFAGSESFFTGGIYLVRFYNGTVLTDAQVLQNYNAEAWRLS